MMTTIRNILLLYLFLGSFKTGAQSDSLQTAKWLDSALFDPGKQAIYLQRVAKLEQKNRQNKLVLADILALRIKFELRRGNTAGAGKLVQRSKKTFRKQPELQANFYSLEGSVLATERQFERAIEKYQLALRIYDSMEMDREAAYVKNNIANVFFNLNDFESAYTYASESYELLYNLKDTVYYPQVAAIVAISEAKTKREAAALIHAKTAIYAGEKYRLPVAVILGKYALGDVFSQEKNWKKAMTSYSEVVVLSEKLHLFQLESYGRIGLLSCYVSLDQYPEAIAEGEKVLTLTKALNLHYSDYTVYQQLSEAYYGVGNYQKAFDYLRNANTMYREYSSVENKKTIQELLTRYETEKKERELSQKELVLSRALVWILGLVFTLFLLIVLFLWRQKQHRNRLETMRLNAEKRQLEAFVEGEKRERERIASDIHDGIASALTGLLLQVEQTEISAEAKTFAAHLKDIRDEVRLISRNISPFNFKEEGWNQSFRRFISSVQSVEFSVHFTARYDELQLNNQRGMVVYRMLQELIQNTLKHAEATECELLILEENDGILIRYADNGKGTTQQELEKGNGWQSFLMRLNAINGKLVLEDDSFDGFKIDISLPKL